MDDQFKDLPEELRRVAREKGTEVPFTGEYVDTEDQGMYKCAVCGNELFSSEAKFHSGSGWPSFYDAIPGSVEFANDESFGMHRIEVTCKKCGSHLGHIFEDGPKDKGGKRFCINSVCLKLDRKE